MKMTNNAYLLSAQEVIAGLRTDPEQGLSDEEAAERLRREGKNLLPQPPATPAWRRFLMQFQNTLTVLLLAATVISFTAWLLEPGHGAPYETIAILAIVLLNGVLGYLQESRAEHAVAALQAMSAAKARLLRGGRQVELPSENIVSGDIVLLEEGDAIGADGRIIESIGLQIAEAPLTGESTPVSKDTGALSGEVGIGDRLNMVFSGTTVVSGRGRAVATATGPASEIGKIAHSLGEAEDASTPLQRELDWVGKRLGAAVVFIAVMIALLLVWLGGVQSTSDVVRVLLFAVSLAVAAVPEGLTAITTVTLSLGVQRMAKRRVIVRKLSAVESLGSTTVICTDKTGTLTKNEMTMRALVTASGRVDFTGSGYSPEGEAQSGGQTLADPELLHEARLALTAGVLANNANLVQRNGRWEIEGDPTEGALVVAAYKLGLPEKDVERGYPRIGELPFTSARKLMSTVHRDAGEGRRGMAAKGAPDILLSRCSSEQFGRSTRPLTEERRRSILDEVNNLAGAALRTLGLAYRIFGEAERQAERWSEDAEEALVFLGIAGIIDPPRPEAAASVAAAQLAGVRVIMVTGDHPRTAQAIAQELGIAGTGSTSLSGGELERLGEEELIKRAPDAAVYARVAPEHKLQLVRRLKAEGHIVAMTGDGVNDAPALKAADIGVAMAITGTDVSKQASDMILTDDNFASIVAAIEEGRSIFRTIRATLLYLLSSNTGEVLVMFLGVLLAGQLGFTAASAGQVFLPLLAVQILWINLFTDAAPALALAMEPPDPAVMSGPPRDPRSRVVDSQMWLTIAAVGVVMAGGTLLVMDYALPGGLIAGRSSPEHARTMGFMTLVFFQLFNIFNARSPGRSAFIGIFKNYWLWLAVLLTAVMQPLVVYMAALQAAFGTTALAPGDWALCLAAASSVLWLSELYKLLTAQQREARKRR